MDMLASANASRASELNSILNRMESLQEASTRASRVSLLGKYLQALLDKSSAVWVFTNLYIYVPIPRGESLSNSSPTGFWSQPIDNALMIYNGRSS